MKANLWCGLLLLCAPSLALADIPISATSLSAGNTTAAATVNPEQTPVAQLPSTKTREELFLEVFKRPALNIPVSSYVFFVLDGVRQQKVKVDMSQGEQNMLLEGKPVMAFLSQGLRPDIVQRLEQKIDAAGWLNRAALEEEGVATSFNLSKFEFSVTTTPKMREKRVLYLTPLMVDPFIVDAIRPAPVSAFINFDLKGVARTETAAAATSNAGFSANGAMNVMGVVVEGSAFGQTGDANSLQRGDVRLVYDQPQRALRYSAGDLRYPVIGYQTVVNMGGIGISKDFSLQPHVRTHRTGGQFEFYLERPAEVKVWVNESLVSTLQLPAGTHDIRGLTPVVGQNDTRLVIEDNAGRREVLHFSFIFNPILLEKGRNLFSTNAGFHRELKDGIYQYDLKKPVLSASYLEGFTDETTLGVYTQADASRSLFGVKTIHVLPAGTLQLDTATSRSGDGKWDVGAKIDWIRIPDTRGGPGVQSQLSVEYLGQSFGSIAAPSPDQKNVLNFNAGLAFPMGNGVTAQLSGSYTPARVASSVDAHRVTATLNRSWRWGKYTTASAALRHRRSNQNETQTELLFGIRYNFSKGRSSFYAAKEMETDTVTSGWASGRSSNSTAPYGFASTRLGSDRQEYLGGFGYSGNQGLAEASHTRTETNQPQGKSARDETTVRLQSALVFANTTFALARPVAENFAIVKGKDGLAGVDMQVDPDGSGGSRAQSSWLSPAVLVDLSSYRLRDLRIEPVNPPLGASPEKLSFTLLPTYKSGFLLKLGKERRIIAIGRLVDDQRGPLAHLPIEIRRLDDRDEKPVSTITSRGGGFQMPDIKPGRYEIRPSSTTRWGSVTVEIPETQDDLYRLGDVVVLP